MTGDSWTSVHEGTDALLFQPWNTTTNVWRMGADLKLFPRTVFSYDQIWNSYKGEQLSGAQQHAIPGFNGVPARPWPRLQYRRQPALRHSADRRFCHSHLLSLLLLQPFRAHPHFLSDRAAQLPQRLPAPPRTHRQRQLHLGRTENAGLRRTVQWLRPRQPARAPRPTDAVLVSRVAAVADFGAVINITDRFRIVDKFRFNNFRLPGALASLNNDLYGANLLTTPNVFELCHLPAALHRGDLPATHAAVLARIVTVRDPCQFLQAGRKDQHHPVAVRCHAGSWRRGSAIATTAAISIILSSDLQVLTFYPTHALRGACAGRTLVNGVCTATAAQQQRQRFRDSAAFTAGRAPSRPSPALRANFDAEKSYADYSLTRISPRKQSRYRANGTYTPRPWAVLGASMNLLSNSNDDLAVNYRGHANNYGFNAELNPRPRFGADLAYNYSGFQQNAIICFNDTPPAGVILPVVTNAGSCAANDAANPLLTNGYYENKTHYGMTAFMLKPILESNHPPRLQHDQYRRIDPAIQHSAAARRAGLQLPPAGCKRRCRYRPRYCLAPRLELLPVRRKRFRRSHLCRATSTPTTLRSP